MKNDLSERILETVPREKGFYFFTSLGNYTGESAISLKEFMQKINQVTPKSLEFHLYRGDFEKWITQVLGDEELVLELKKLQKANLTGDTLRSRLYAIVSRNYNSLESKIKGERSENVSPK